MQISIITVNLLSKLFTVINVKLIKKVKFTTVCKICYSGHLLRVLKSNQNLYQVCMRGDQRLNVVTTNTT